MSDRTFLTQRNEQWDYRVYLKWAESVIEELDPHGIGMYPEDLAKAAMALPSHGITQLAVPEAWKVADGYLPDSLHFSRSAAEDAARRSNEAAEIDGGSHWRPASITPLAGICQPLKVTDRCDDQSLLQVLTDIANERIRQDGKWGGPEHDDQHSPNDFVQLVEDYAGWARVMAGMDSLHKYRRRMMQVAALAVAAIQATDRALARTNQTTGQEGVPNE